MISVRIEDHHESKKEVKEEVWQKAPSDKEAILVDAEGIRHSVELEADNLYEDAVLASLLSNGFQTFRLKLK